MGISGALLAAMLVSSPATYAHVAAVGCSADSGKQIAVTREYRITLLVGKVENMYMPYQVRVNKLKHGEVMLRGRMTTGALLTGGPIRHLEVQICGRAKRRVVTDANPRIVVDDRTSGKRLTLPVSVMEGIGAGAADLHYGNNLAMPVGHSFVVTVTWRGERALFRFALPPAHRRH